LYLLHGSSLLQLAPGGSGILFFFYVFVLYISPQNRVVDFDFVIKITTYIAIQNPELRSCKSGKIV
jgi:hypothetical protein